MAERPKTQTAVQLVGADELRLNREKPVPEPGPHQFLVQTEAVGLCFSDMKLLHQFDGHVRKGPVVSGLDATVLDQMPNYVPGSAPTVPGHEVACRVVAVGEGVRHYHVGDRFIVQADYRPFRTANSNGAFGYNFEGGLQEYVLMDERVVGDPADEHGFMIPVPADRPASAVALVEPWACVENSYVTSDRRGPKADGALLIVARSNEQLQEAFRAAGYPEENANPGGDVVLRTRSDGGSAVGICAPDVPASALAEGIRGKADEAFDDIWTYESNPELIEALDPKLRKGGVLAVLGGPIGRPVSLDVGRLHYGGTRFVGGPRPEVAYAIIPATGEIRPQDRVLVVGAGGPMGQMHVIRALLGFPDAEVVASDTSPERLAALDRKVAPLGGRYRSVLASDLSAAETFDVIALMAPVPALVSDAIRRARPDGIVNVFAGIPAGTRHPIDLDAIVEKRLYVFGTSGSEPRDMRLVLSKLIAQKLDTNLSVAAVSGMAGAIDGLRAVENRTLDGKIVVYPSLPDLPLTPLSDLPAFVRAKLNAGSWTAAAEAELLRGAQ